MGTTTYGYDDAGNLRTIAYPTGHTIDYQTDAADPALISGVVLDADQTLASNIAYAPFGPVKSMTLGNGIQTLKTYDKSNNDILVVGKYEDFVDGWSVMLAKIFRRSLDALLFRS